jgi:putative Flp pilus-assembly TadE/G-like protein
MTERKEQRRQSERGQITIFVVLALGIFLLAFMGLATDYSSFWFTRQAAQGAADATCQAAASDLYLYALKMQTPNMNFTPKVGSAVDCSTATTAAPCIIAKYNGFDATAAGNSVQMTFPETVSGISPPPPWVTVPYVQVDVTRQAAAYFSRLLTGKSTVAVHTSATCGLTVAPDSVPIIVLHPWDPETINMAGSKNAITVVGGPQKSIQVNSRNSGAVTSNSLSLIDLSQGGPKGTGSNLGTWGGQPTAPSSVILGSTGRWEYPAYPIEDPYKLVNEPVKPSGSTPPVKAAAYGVNGCPDTLGCDEFSAGYYPNGICVKGGGGCPGGGTQGTHGTAIFDPGLYYLGGRGLNLDSNTIVRVSCCGGVADGDHTGGVIFYFAGTGTLNVVANSGAKPGVDVYHRDGGTFNGVQSRALQCPGGAGNPPQIPATIDGNVLLGPCSGTYSGSGGQSRGFLFFQDRSAAADPSWQGGGTTLASGFMYFHQCKADGTGLDCSDPGTGGYGTTFHLGGNPGSGSYTIGSIITDKIATNGNPGITMILNPAKDTPQLKIVLLK